MSIDRFTMLYDLYTKKKDIFIRSFIRVCILVFLIGISSITNAQTVGGMRPSDDFDGDGIINSIDLDDDNDGILDATEMTNCNTAILITPSAATSSPVYGGAIAARTIDGTGFTGSGLAALATAPATLDDAWLLKEPLTSGFIEYTLPANSNIGGVVLWAPDAFNYGGGDGPPKDFTVEITYKNGLVFNTGVYTTARPNSSGANPGAQVFNFPQSFLNATKVKLNIINGWYDINGNSIGQVSTDGQTVNAAYNMFLGEFRVLCGATDIDTDNDGIPNRLDLDSDGDGCTDAAEAGVSGTLISGDIKNGIYEVVKNNTTKKNAIAAAPYGSNGLADGVETAPESGLINYTSKYEPQALSKNLASCADTDGDGVFDSVDIDDDNDGVLDSEESPSCYMTTDEWNTTDKSLFVKITSDLNTLAPNSVYGKLTDGDGNGAAIQFSTATAQAQLNKAIYKIEFSSPTQLDALYIKKNSPTQIFAATAASLKLQGSTDNTSWTDLTAAIASPADASNTTVNGAKVLTNSNKFSVTTGAGKYKYYRIYGVVAANILSGIANEFFFDVNTATYQSSYYPKAECSNDTDGDGILNHQDLDSDGDGCSDAIESKSSTTATSTTVYPLFTSGDDTNSNGLLNVYESTTAGVVNYTSLYDPFATSANLAACKDTDSDGISDDIDLDDDNDGILDAVESPDCYYSANDWHYGNRSDIKVTSGLSMTSPQNQPQKLVDGINSGVSYDVRMETTTTTVNALGTGRQVYQFNMNIPVKLSKILLGYTGIYSHFNDGTKLILRGSNDVTNWTFLSGSGTSTSTAAVTYDATINTSSATETSTIYPYPATTQYATSANIFSVTQNAAKYQYYDIFWSSGGGINNTGYANEVYFDVTTDYIPSAHPKVDCTNDTDGDGILNHQDLDSDGDGCPDAKEAGITATLTSASVINLAGSTIASGTSTSTIQNAIVAGMGTSTFGNNGFVNSLETSSETGIYSGTYNYSLATNKSISTCLDSDGDGVSDVLDLDDDNDGVLDIVECPVPGKQPLLSRFDIASGASKTASFTGFPEELWIDVWTLDNNFNLKVNNVDITNVSELNFAPLGASYAYPKPYTDIVRTNGTAIYPSGSVWTFPNTAQYPLIRVKISNNGYSKIYGYDFVNGTGNYNELVLVNAVYQKVPINLTGNNTIVISQDNTWAPSNLNAEFNTYSGAGICDTDGDGQENRLDLDSDNDGCSDALESKTTTSTTPNYQYANNFGYGTNGFLNTLETVSDNGIYNGSYPYDYAINSTVKGCLDSDGDGVPDVFDLDDDNDGILDAVESPTCFYSLSELAKPASVSSDLNPYDATGTYAVEKSIDGLIVTYSAFKGGQYLANNEILKYTANGLIDIISLTLDLDFRAISTDASSTFRFQGSADNVIWDNFNTAVVASITTTFPSTLVLTNDLQAGKKYKYFRLYGVAGTSNHGGVANATFNLASSNRPSANPKLTCTNDTDVDGIPNHLDLDADGDGCPDAKEAGVIGLLTTGSVVNLSTPSGTATTTSTNVPSTVASGTYGSNGFANALETAIESGLYSGTYNYDFAISKTFNACTDTDSDGIPDLVDIDDDNDGILDAVESPTCFYNIVEMTKPTAISTDLLPYSTTVIGNAIDADLTSYSAFAPSQNWVGKTLFNLTANAQIPISGINFSLVNWALSNPSNTTGNTFKLQGSNDNNIWTDLSIAISSSATTGIINIPNTLSATSKFKYYQIVGVAGASYYAGVTDINFVIASTYVQSQYTKPTCLTGRSDGDIIPNHLDLDSDGDGCSDAIESGTSTNTTANYKFTGAAADFGANGFYNVLEKTNAESNLYNGTYTYYYAIDKTINVCLDSDGDGVKDIIDLDDDNDGVLDYVEQSCEGSVMSKSDITISSAVNWTFQNAPAIGLNALIDGSLIQQMYPTDAAIANKTIFQFNFIAPKVLNLIELANVANQTPFIAGGTYKIQGSNDEGTTWSDIVSSQVVANTAPILATTNSIKFNMPANYISFLSYRIYAISMTGQANWSTEAYFREVTCEDINTDGDATPNRLDLDSDGDGCPDAVEAGTTAVSTSGVASSAKLTASVIPAPYGNNGFANGLETASESGAYSGTYTYSFVTDATVNGCRDTDGDGVPDVLDLDDDNDGILDTIEDNCSVIVVNKTGAIITKPSTINYTFNGNTIANLIDGVDNNVYVINGPSGTLNGPWLNFEFPSPKALTYLEIGHYSGQYLFSTTSTYKIQGSGDNTNWTDVSGTLTYNNIATSTSGGLSNNNSNIANFPTNTKAYKYYRISGINATAGAGWATEIHFKEFVCATADLDGDGIPNRMDLDSDGDGCPDAVEAGTTAISISGVSSPAKLTTSIIPAPYGNNGFANGLETTSESGLYTGTYTYNYAIDATINACTDTDGDGVPDVIDLDDDNDGVLDSSEQINCVTSEIDLTTLTYNGTSITAKTASSFTTAGGDTWKSSYSNENLKLPISLKFKHNSTTGYEMFGLIPIAGAQTTASWNDAGYKFYPQTTNVYGYFTYTTTGTWDFGAIAILPTDVLSIDISATGYVTAAINGVTKKAFQGVISDYKLAISSYRASSLTDIILIDATRPTILTCTEIDTDGDGIPNRLDLDSDGDGCPDAKESGVNGTLSAGSVKNGTGGAVTSTATVANAIAAGPYGNNGLANGVETSTESGVVTYTSTYALNALVKDLVVPAITTQPLNRTVFIGTAAVLTTTAAAPPANRTLTYQWYKAGVAITGATSATYTVTSAAISSTSADYYCSIGYVNSCLSTNTNTVNITVLTNPVGLTACQDGSAVLSVTKTGTNAVTYQWRKATTNLVNGAKIAGATTTSLTLTNLALADAGAYTLVATDANGAVITSLAGTITITNNTKYTIPDYTTCVTASNYTLTGTMVAGTSGATSTVWERSTDGGNTWSPVASGDGVTYTVTTTTSGGTSTSTLRLSSVIAGLNGYKYRIATTNATCTNYSNVSTITVNSAPTITAQPSNSVLCNVFGTSFTAAATGANLTYQWQTRAPLGTWTTITALNANTIDAGVVYSNYATATLNLSAAPATENNNQYQVLITNSCGTATSTTAVLNPTVATPTITTSNFTVCEGTPITLTTSSSTASPTYQWYLGGATIGGATGATYNPTASGIYSVIANATGYCKSGTASATVTINPAPLVAIAQGTTLTLSGGSEQLTGVASPSGTYTYAWYNGSSIVSGASTSNIYNVSSVGNYTVRATNTLTNCYANSSIITINRIPSNTVSGSTSFCVGGSVQLSTTMATGADGVQWLKDGVAITTTSSSLTYTATTSGAYAAQFYVGSVPLGGLGILVGTNTTISTIVTVNTLPTAIISNTASGTTLCAGTNAILTASSGAASATYQWYNNNTIITGATASTYTATSSGNYSFKVTDISCDCSATSISSTVTLVSPPAAPNLTATSKIICVNTTADLTVFQPLALAGTSYEWHSASNTLSSTLVANAAAVGTAGTYYLFAKNNSGGCYSTASVAFTLSLVTITQATLTGASSPTYTIGDIPVALNASTSNPTYSLRWYTALTGGVALAAPVLPSTATAGITNYYVEQYDATSSFCTSNPRQLAAVTVKPLAPIVANITYCQNATALSLTATPATGGTLNWYGTAATGGTLTATATIPATGTVTNTIYYVSQTVNGVEGARAALTVTINALPSAPSVISGTFSVTSTNSYTYSVTSIANTTYQWTLPSFMSGTSTTSSISALVNSAGSGNISVIAVNANGCLSPASSSSISAVLYVAPPPATTNVTYTIGDPAIPANTSSRVIVATDATINYYTSNAAGSKSTTEQSIPTTAGVYTYYVSQTINGVESALVPYTVTIKPQKPIVADITYCQNDVPVALTATGTALQWYTVSTAGTATSTAPTPSTGTATTTTYYVTQTVNGVESDRIALVVTINPTPATPSSISGLTITSTANSETYSVTNDASATGYVWVLPNGWTGTSSINSITATVGLSGGQIKVKAISGACSSPFSTKTVDILNVTNPPLTTDVTFVTGSTPSNILSNTSSLITGSASSTINYYTSNVAGTASSTSQTTPTTPGVYTYYVSQTSSIGVESILVPYTITIKPIAPPININNGIVGNTITYCKGASAFALTATASTGGTLKWYTVATGGASSNSAPTPSTSLVGTSNYYVSQVVNSVESDRVLIVVTINDAPAAITATATQPTCTNSSGYIVITSPLGTGFTYSIDGSNYTNTTLFSALPAGIYFATAKNNQGCVSAPTQITINKAVAPPLSPLVSVVQPTCSITTGSISITSSTLNTDTYSIDGGLNYQASKLFTGVAPGTYTVTTLNAGGCVSAGTTATVNAALAVPAQPSISSSSASASICEGTTVTLTSSALTGNQWYKDGVLIAGAINQTYSPNASGTYAVIATNASGCSSIPSADEVITINPLPTPVISNGATLAFNNCTTTIITLTASNTSTSTGNTYQWYLNGNSINVGGTNSTYNANQAGNYSVVITNNGCSATSPISKLIAAPSVNAANTTFCEGGSSLITGNSTGFTNPTYQWKVSTNDGLSFVNAIGAGTNSLTYTATTAGKYQLEVTDGSNVSTSCPINVTVFTNPTATITASPSASVCVGSIISLNANVASGTAHTYQWLLAGGNDIAGAALSTYTTGITGSYAVKVTDANGCIVNAAPSTISFNAVPTAPVVTIINPTCDVATGTISVTSPLGVGYTYSIDGTNYSNTTGLFTGLIAASTYTVTVKSSTGCTSNATVATIAAALVVPAQPVITGPANVNTNSINTYSVAAVAGATSYSWNIPDYWSGVSTTNTINIKVDASSGSLNVTANSASCVSAAATKNIITTKLNSDINVTNVNVPVSGKLTTNDVIPAGTTYGQPGTNAANPTGAKITVNADGSYTFTATTPGKYTYYIPVCAAGQTTGCPLSPLEITVLDPLAVTDKPVANNDIATTKSGTATTVNILANDVVGNSGGTLNTSSVSIASAPKNGVAVVNSDGTITYTPAAGFVGTDSVVYNVCDNSSPTPLCQTAVVYFTVVPASAPSTTIAIDDYATVLASTGGTNAVSGNVLTNDKNTGGASLTTSLVTGPTTAQGSFTMNADGSYTFTPTAGFSGPVDITYTVCTGATPAACATATIHILVEPAQVLNPDAATAYINIEKLGNISTNDVIQPGSTYAQPTQQSGATITVNTDGTYSFTATVAGTYTYTVPVCAPGQTTNCPTETIVFTVPVNTLVNDVDTAFVNIPKKGNISSNDVVPAGTTYGTPVADPTNPAAGSGAASSGAVLTMTANGTYTFTATVAGTYTYTVPVCAPGQTTNCPTETIVFTVPVNTFVNDAANALINIPKTGSIATNDVVPTGTTYGTPVAGTTNPAAGSGAASSGAVLTMTANGTYTFTATVAGTFTYTVPVCAPGQTSNCPTTTIVFTVIGSQPQGAIHLKYDTLLASDSVHVKLKAYDGIGPYTMIFKNSINNRIDTVKNIIDSAMVMLPPSSNDAIFTLIKIIDNGNNTRLNNFDKDTARLTILRPKILLTLKADLPLKLPDNSFKTKIVMKIKNNGALYLQNVQVNADLSKVFPADMQFILDSIKVASGNLALNPTYTGFGIPKAPRYVAKSVNGFSIKYRTLATLSGSDLFNDGVNLDINEEGSVVFYLTLKPGVNIEPLVLQFTSAGDGVLVQKDGNKSMQPTTSISHDNSNVNAHPSVTTIGQPLPTYIPFFLINEIGASLEASLPDTVNNGYVFRFKSIIKNYSNSNLDSVAASFDINQFIKTPDAASIYGTPTVAGTTSFNTKFDGKNDIQFFKGVSQLKVGDSIKIAFDLFVKTDKTKAIWPTYLIAKGVTTTGDLKVTDTSTNGSNPDPNGNKIPDESIRTLIGIGIDPPPAPEVIAAVYEVDDKRNPKNISHLIKKIPIGTVPTWCNMDGTACSFNPPLLPNIVGTYIWCVKSLDTITGLSSKPCVYDTVRIIPINKYSKYDIIKSAKNIEYDLSGTVIVGFNIKVVNNTDRQIDYILIQDDLTNTFKRADGFKLLSISSSGTLVTNYNFNGISNIEMLQPESYLKAYSTDSIVFKIMIESASIDGDFNNSANMKIRSDYGMLDLLSNDTVVNKNGLTSRVATKFKVPKIELNIPGGFSPNNDGIDDAWFIKRPFGTKISVQVFNRWGNEVYSNSDYKNDWRGIGVSNFMGEDVVEGTYFYIVLATDMDGAIKKFAGSLTIVR